MIRKGFLTSLPVCALIALLAAFLFVSPAFAQDEVPPEVVPTEAPVEMVPTEVTPAEVTPTEVASADGLPAEPEVVVGAPVEEPSLAEVLNEADVVLADAAGEQLSFAARGTLAAATSGDPYFDVGSTRYSFYKTGTFDCGTALNVTCFLSDTPISRALQIMEERTLTPTDRKLYIQPDTYNETVYLDGSADGVKGLVGIKGIDGTADQVVINGHLYIVNFLTGFSVENLSVYNSTSSNDAAIWAALNLGTLKFTDVNAQATGEDMYGMLIDHTGPVELNRVNSDNNGYMGARIINATSVKITNSTFDNNLQNVNDGDGMYDSVANYTGLYLDNVQFGPVTINGVSVSNNIGDGFGIEAYNSAVSVKNSVFDNNDEAGLVDDYGDGLYIDSNSVTLENIQANNNDLRGIKSYANVSFTGTHLHTESNVGSGIEVNTCFDWDDGDSMCDTPGAGTVTIKNSGISGNGGSGLDIYAKGAVTVTSLYSGWNGDDGLHIVTYDSPGSPAIVLKALETPGNDYGIYIDGRGATTLTDFKSNDNRMDGVGISNMSTSAIIFTNASGIFNETRNNGGNGFYIWTMGPVTVTNLDSHDNGLLGGYIDNSFVPTTALPAVMVNVLAPAGFVNGYWNNGTGGLQVLSRGAVTISKISVTDNRGAGLDINNIPPGLVAGAAVTITDANINHNRNGHWDDILEEWVDDDSNNDEDGLRILSKGLITLSNVSSNNNDGYGATLTNTAGTAGVTINATTGKGNEFQWNSLDGLRVLTNGAVALTNVYSSNNLYDDGVNPILGGYGLYIDNHTGTAAVTIKQVGSWCGNNFCTEGNNFSNNLNDGLSISSRGVVTVAFFQARGNRGTGIYIDASGGAGAVTVNGTQNYWESLIDNGVDGLHVSAKGNITISKIRAGGSGHNGAMLQNNIGTGNVTLTDAYFDWNNNYGLEIISSGVVTWKNGFASENFYNGARIVNLPSLVGATGKAVTITNVETSRNGLTGLYIESKGAVTITDSQSDTNSPNYFTAGYDQLVRDNLNDDQVWVFNGLAGEDVTIEVFSSRFNPWINLTDPNGDSISYMDDADEDGTVILTFTDLTMDGQYQIHLGSMYDWNGYGYEMKLYEGEAPIIFSEPDLSANGIYVDNHTGTGAVTITNTYNRWNSNNSGTNVAVLSSGVVSLKGMDLNDSGDDGLLVNNTTAIAGSPGVTLTGVNYSNNDGDATYIITKGAVVVKTADLNNNWGRGFYVDNKNFGSALSPITFTNVNMNGWGSSEPGIYLRSRGIVTFTNITSDGNGGAGMDIDTLGAVTFTNTSAWGNSGYGAHVVTPGIFTLNAPVEGFNWFGNNQDNGLFVEAGGKITLNKVKAQNNGKDWGNNYVSDAYGIYLVNTNGLGLSPIVFTDITTIGNTMDGLKIITNGAVTINTMEARDNTRYGIYIDQTGAPDSTKAIILNKITANNNGYDAARAEALDGLYVNAKGSITTNFLVVNSNAMNGANLLNNNGASTGTVTMLNTLGKNLAIGNNKGVGVNIVSFGAVTVTDLEAIYNKLDGLVVNNMNVAAVVKPAVTLNTIISRFNENGIHVTSSGVVTINGSWSASNRQDGIGIHTAGNVFINNTTSIMNDWAGIWAEATSGTPAFKLTNSTWFGNLRNSIPGDKNLMLSPSWVLTII